MHYEFEARCRDARAGIAVPPLHISAIRDAVAARRPSRRPTFIVTVAATIALGAVAAAAAWQTHVYVATNGTVNLYAHRMTVKFAAPTQRGALTQADALAAARQVDFPVVLPTGLPAGTRLTNVTRADTSAISLGYDLPGAWRRSHHLLNVVLANPVVVGSTRPPATARFIIERWLKPSHTVRWTVGGEDVIVSGSLTSAELARLQAAMRAAQPITR